MCKPCGGTFVNHVYGLYISAKVTKTIASEDGADVCLGFGFLLRFADGPSKSAPTPQRIGSHV